MRRIDVSIRELIESRCEWIGDCLVFQGGTCRGYGVIQIPGTRTTIQTHRAMYQEVHEVILERNQVVMHSCDNPGCCNPEHLSLGTHRDNARDSVKKGRKGYGGMKPKLNSDDHKKIKELSKTLHVDEIARVYNVHGTTIQRILSGQTKARSGSDGARAAANARWAKVREEKAAFMNRTKRKKK